MLTPLHPSPAVNDEKKRGGEVGINPIPKKTGGRNWDLFHCILGLCDHSGSAIRTGMVAHLWNVELEDGTYSQPGLLRRFSPAWATE